MLEKDRGAGKDVPREVQAGADPVLYAKGQAEVHVSSYVHKHLFASSN